MRRLRLKRLLVSLFTFAVGARALPLPGESPHICQDRAAIDALVEALNRGEALDVDDAEKLEIAGWSGAVRRFIDSDYSSKRDRQLADHLLSVLQDHPDHQPLLQAATRFARRSLRGAGRVGPEDPFWRLRCLTMARRLGVDAETIEAYPAFAHFIGVNHLEAIMSFYGHQVTKTPEGMPMLLVGGKLVPFDELRQTLPTDRRGRLTEHLYLENGFVLGSSRNAVQSHLRRAPSEDGMAGFEIISANSSVFHAWLRLISPEGEVYSAGFFGRTAITGFGRVMEALLPETGRVLSPDPMEFIVPEDKRVTTHFEITPEEFEKALAMVRELQNSEDICYEILSLFRGQNCASFLTAIAAELGISVSDRSLWIPFANPISIRDWQKELPPQLPCCDN